MFMQAAARAGGRFSSTKMAIPARLLFLTEEVVGIQVCGVFLKSQEEKPNALQKVGYSYAW